MRIFNSRGRFLCDPNSYQVSLSHAYTKHERVL
nr:MAG TPA: hypothetical protein [Caudoviricetes sp.]